MATDLATPEREEAARLNRLKAMKGAELPSIRVVHGDEGTVIPLTSSEGKEVLALVRELYENKSSSKPRKAKK